MKDYRASVPNRLERLRRLRAMKAPTWIIKSEQVALVCNKEGKKFVGIGKTGNKRQEELFLRHVVSALDKVGEE